MALKVLIFVFLAIIVFNLFAGLKYMMTDKGRSDKTVRALTWRIGLSFALFAILIVLKGLGMLPANVDPLTGEPPEGAVIEE